MKIDALTTFALLLFAHRLDGSAALQKHIQSSEPAHDTTYTDYFGI